MTRILQNIGSVLIRRPRSVSVRTANLSTSARQIPVGSLLYGQRLATLFSPTAILISSDRPVFTVPASENKFLHKSLSSDSSTIVYDLEDSVHTSAKDDARKMLSQFLQDYPSDLPSRPLNGLSLAVRPNNPFTGQEDAVASTGSIQGDLHAGGQADVESIWGATRPKAINGGAGPMMLMPKVRRYGSHGIYIRLTKIHLRSKVLVCWMSLMEWFPV